MRPLNAAQEPNSNVSILLSPVCVGGCILTLCFKSVYHFQRPVQCSLTPQMHESYGYITSSYPPIDLAHTLPQPAWRHLEPKRLTASACPVLAHLCCPSHPLAFENGSSLSTIQTVCREPSCTKRFCESSVFKPVNAARPLLTSIM